MEIEWIKISGFRNFDNDKINLSKNTLIIGANDVGKTNLLYALRLLFDRSLSDRELDLSNSDYNVYTKSETIEITVKLTKVYEDCLKSTFKEDIKDGSLFIQYKNSKQGEYSILTGSSEKLLELKNSRFYLKRLNMEYVHTNRNLTAFIKKEKNQILEYAKSQLNDEKNNQDKNVIEGIENKLNDINIEVDKLNYIQESLIKVNEELESLAIHNEGQKLTFKNVNSNIDRMLNNIELTYNTDEGALTIGGDGRNNQIFLATWISKQKNIKSLERVTFYAIEEPEAHLHPHQQRKLSNYLLENFSEQIFITTHSPHIATDFKPNKIVKLYRQNKKNKIAKGGCSEDLELIFDDFGYRLNAITSDLFFVNAVFLVEGPSEKLFYNALSKSLSIDLDRLNVSIISVDGVGFKPFLKVCLALDIPFVLRTDNDIFTKTKKVNDKNVEFSYQAGISRVIGIYKDILTSENKDKLLKFWDEIKHETEWEKSKGTPQVAHENVKQIIEIVECDNIYFAEKDLENDIVNSALFNSLKEFYQAEDKNDIVKKMQTAKANNMFNYLKNNIDQLSYLESDPLAKPLYQIKDLAEKVASCYE